MKGLKDRFATLKGAFKGAAKVAAGALAFVLASPAVQAANPVAVQVIMQMPVSVTLEAGITASPSPVSVGQSFLVNLTVTNTGAGPANNLSSTAWKQAGTGSAGYSLANPPSVASLGSGAMVTFTWTATALASGTISFSGSVSDDSGNFSNKPVSPVVTIQNPANLSATLLCLATSVCSGGNILVTMTVTNNGQATAMNVNADDPIPGGTGSLTLVDGPNPPMPVSIPGGNAVTWTWTFSGAALGVTSLTSTAFGTDINSGLTVTSTPRTSNPVNVTAAGSLDVLAFAKSPVSVGQPFTVTMSVTNIGGTSVTGLTPTIWADTGAGLVLPPDRTVPGGPVTLAPGASQFFTWTFTPTGAGTVSFSSTAMGVSCGSPLVQLANAVSTVVQAGATLMVSSAAWPATVNVGQPFLVTLTVTNNGTADAINVNPNSPLTFWAGTGGASYSSGPNPAGPTTIPGGTSLTFTWTYTGLSAGTVQYRTAVPGNDANSGKTVSVAAAAVPSTPVVTVQSPANLTVSASSSAASICTGANYVVTLNISNAGGAAAALNVTASPFLASGTGAAVLVDGPYPATMPVSSLAGGSSLMFTYTFTGAAAGGVILTTTVWAEDANSGSAIVKGPVNTANVTVSDPGTLTATMTTPPGVSTGQAFQVKLNLTNSGGQPVSTVTPSLAIAPGAGLITLASGPTPASFGSLPAGGPYVFTWNYNATAPGLVVFSATAAGTTCGGLPIQGWQWASVTVYGASTLEASVKAWPTPVVLGSAQAASIMVTMTVTNTGGAVAQSVTPFISTSGGVGVMALVAGPNPPSGSVSLAGGAAQTFTWTFTGAAAGIAGLNGAGTKATDQFSGLPVPVTLGPNTSVTVHSAAVLVSTLTLNPTRTGVGDTVVARFTVANTGSADVDIDTLNRGDDDNKGGTVLNAPTAAVPAPTVRILGNSSTVFTWSYNTTDCGWATVWADAIGTEVLSGKSTWSGTIFSAGLGVAGAPVTVIGTSDRAQEKAGSLAFVTFQAFDNCTPPVPVARTMVDLIVVEGGGMITPDVGQTDDNGKVTGTLRLGNEPGRNTVWATVLGAANPTGTAYVTGVVGDKPEPYLTKNFFDPRKGQKLQVRTMLPAGMKLEIRVYNQAGELIRKLYKMDVPAGMTVAEWDGRNDQGELVGNGVYFVQISSGKDTQIKRVIVLKL